EPNDLYLTEARLSPEGVLLDLDGVYNLTRSSGVDESMPLVRRGARAESIIAYSASVDGIVTGFHTMDLAGHSPDEYGEFAWLQRWQTAVTNLQQTGQRAGVTKNAYALDPPADSIRLAFGDNGQVVAVADGRRIVVDPADGGVKEGAGWVRASPFVR